MSLTQRLKQGFLRLPPMKKVILISSFTLSLSTVLPWYDQRNNFGVGETYLGLQGPLFTVGLIILGCGVISFLNIFIPLFGRNFFELKRKTGTLALSFGVQSLLLLLVANSIFFHPDFAATINNKGTRFGMILAFLSIGTLMISGWWVRRKERSAGAEGEEREYEMEDIITPMPIPSESIPVETIVAPSYQAARNFAPNMVKEPEIDPLTLDARTRYKMMKAQGGQHSPSARNNLWGGNRNGSPYSARRPLEEDSQY